VQRPVVQAQSGILPGEFPRFAALADLASIPDDDRVAALVHADRRDHQSTVVPGLAGVLRAVRVTQLGPLGRQLVAAFDAAHNFGRRFDHLPR
jgi:hypothetical protein